MKQNVLTFGRKRVKGQYFISCTGYYMTFTDYCFEGLVPMYACLLVSTWFKLSTLAVAATIMLNFAYAATVHSGWYMPGFPDPGDHWLHHSKVFFESCNFL